MTLHDDFDQGLRRMLQGLSYREAEPGAEYDSVSWAADICSTCEGNGAVPEALDQHGDPAAKYLPWVPYAVTFCETCRDCGGSGKASAPLPHDDMQSSHTAQRGGRFSGGDA